MGNRARTFSERHQNVRRNFIHNNYKLDTTQISTKVEWIHKLWSKSHDRTLQRGINKRITTWITHRYNAEQEYTELFT